MSEKHSDFYESNLELLKRHHPQIWKQITENPPKSTGTIFYTSNEKPNITVTNNQNETITLHPEIDPTKETTDFLKRIPKDHKGFVAILGMGLGYATLDLLKERPYLQRLAIFELDPGIFIQALRYINLAPILDDSRLILSIGSENEIGKTLISATRTLQLENANVFHQLPSFKFNPEGYEQLKNDLFTYLNSQNVEGATNRALGKNFLNNRFEHIATIHHQYLLEQIQDKFAGMPAIMVAGGPSLDKNIHLLKQAQNTAVIIAVDTVLPALLKHGIHPHFLTCIDPYNLTYEKFSDVAPMAKNTSLVCSSWINPKTPKFFPASQIFWTFTAKPVEAWLNSLLGGKMLTRGASTVAHLNLITAQMMGCNPIIFVGQDLAYAGSATHTKETVLHGQAPTGVIIGNTEGQTVTGINGRLLRTNRSFLSMKSHFESAITYSDITFINATYEGAHIEGTKVMGLQEAIDNHCKNNINAAQCIKEQCATINPVNSNKMLIEFTKMIGKITLLNKNIKKADNTCNLVLKDLIKIQKKGVHIKSFDMLSVQLQKQINKIDQLHKALDNALDVWKNLEEITIDGLKKSERQKQDISIFKNDPSNYSKWLTKNIHRLIDINKTRKDTLSIFSKHLNQIISFHKKEKKYLKEKNLSSLVKLYMETNNYNLAKPIVEQIRQSIPESAENIFYRGCIALQYSEHTLAEDFFNAAISDDPKIANRIDRYKHTLGDEFLGFAQYFKTGPINRHASVKYVLRKGLKHCQTHEELKKELIICLKKDLEQIKTYLDTKNFQDAVPVINEWYQNMVDQKYLTKDLLPELVGIIFMNKGILQLEKNNHTDALKNFKKAIEYSPLNKDCYIITIETLFSIGDFNGSIDTIKKAIKVDNEFAIYWETIGDGLQNSDQHEEAIIAYEQCFIYLPNRIDLLKKIGDCYMATDQLEAAKSAYQQLKLKIENNNEPTDVSK